MILVWLILIPLVGGVLAWVFARRSLAAARWIALAATAVQLALAAALWAHFGLVGLEPARHSRMLLDFRAPWVPSIGLQFHLALDGLSLLLVLLTGVLGVVSVAASWRGIVSRTGFYYFQLLWSLAALTGAFLAMDLLLFYFFWEIMLIPLYFLIGVWGHENRIAAAWKFFIFTQAGGLFLLVAILALYFAHHASTGVYTFDYFKLLGTATSAKAAMWMMLGFFIAFAVKLPAVGVHTWLPDAHTQAPTAGSVVLAGLVLKAGAYGLLRFVVPLFPAAAFRFAPFAMALGAAGVLYGALLAFAQKDIKRLVAYTSVSHMGFVLLGVFAWNSLALEGALVIIVAHGLTTGALFLVIGFIQERLHTRQIDRMGGLWTAMPKMGGSALFFALASMGLPGLVNFVGEILVLMGAWQVNKACTAVAAGGLVLSALYALWMMHSAFQGPMRRPAEGLKDLSGREMAMMVALMALTLLLGVWPRPVLSTGAPALKGLRTEAVVRPRRMAGRTPPRVQQGSPVPADPLVSASGLPKGSDPPPRKGGAP